MKSYFEHSVDVLAPLGVFAGGEDDEEHIRDVLELHGSAAIHLTVELATRLDDATETSQHSVTSQLGTLGAIIHQTSQDALAGAPSGLEYLREAYATLEESAYHSLLLAAFLILKMSADEARDREVDFDVAMDRVVASVAMTGVNEIPPAAPGGTARVDTFIETLDADDFAAHCFDTARHIAEVLSGKPVFR